MIGRRDAICLRVPPQLGEYTLDHELFVIVFGVSKQFQSRIKCFSRITNKATKKSNVSERLQSCPQLFDVVRKQHLVYEP